MKKRVLIIGAGPAGLAAAARILETAANEIDVTLVHMGHHAGGKAASYVNARGEHIEHGWHMVLGFYTRMRGLLARAGVSFDRAFSSMRGQSHVYETWSKRLHTIDGSGSKLEFAARFSRYDGLPFGDRANYSRVMADAFLLAASGGNLLEHDDICFDAWAQERGLREHVTRYAIFRVMREGYFNFPERISAYHALQTMRLMGDTERAEAFVCRGRWSDTVWNPIATYVERLGAKIIPYTMVTDFVYEGRKITGLRVSRPDPEGHHHGASAWPKGAILRAENSDQVLSDFDAVISTIPAPVFCTLNQTDQAWWQSSFFKRIKNLRSATTLAMRVITKEPVPRFLGPVFGMRAPLGIATDMTAHLDEKHGLGNVIDFCGQEAGFENWHDDKIIDFTLENYSRLPGMRPITRSDLSWFEFHRNASNHEQLLLCEPGVQVFRPAGKTPFYNLFLAGDWIRNDVDVICMEGAIASADAASRAALSYLVHT